MKSFDKIIIGAGLYGLYAALFCAKRGEHVLVLEYEDVPFKRATYINQARVHMGYHYPRSYTTAIKSAGYFKRFNEDFGFCIANTFEKIYATSSNFSWSDASQFVKFCNAANIPCKQIYPNNYFKDGFCDGAFLTKEYTYDAQVLKEFFVKEIKGYNNIEIVYGAKLKEITRTETNFRIALLNESCFETPFVLNATYASINQILNKCKLDLFKIKYELCEIILCEVNDKLKNIGLTIMDGPFFSIMPFGKTNYHSLTSVTFTPHKTSKEVLPRFECQLKSNNNCSIYQLGNCNECTAKPDTAWPYMSHLASKYLQKDLIFKYHHSLFSIKPILLASEVDDSRPTLIRVFSKNPTFVSVLSGKINTVYDLDEILTNGTL
ncbi:MAG TPA: FAD-dependent oxidoreductase [Bacteroidales bacterium]|nr:FAD-dependent oxidoreductase [Bacteroidales bacterium]